MADRIRKPRQTRSIETKHKIIEAGLDIFCEKGYYNTTTAEIAKVAGVSTGIVYGYFRDKKDVFLQSLDLYFSRIQKPIEETINAAGADESLEQTLREFVDAFITSHRENALSHEEMIAMSHLDPDVNEAFIKSEREYTALIKDHLLKLGLDVPDMEEKVHIAYNMIDSLCHECVYHQHADIDCSVMKNKTVELMLYLFR